MEHINSANSKSIESFTKEYLPPNSEWASWTHPKTQAQYDLSLCAAPTLPKPDFEACFSLIEETSSADYRKSAQGWKPKSKRKEMKLLDLKYLLVKKQGQVYGFVSFMPTEEDDYPVVYCYEIHLSPDLQGTGLGKVLMRLLEYIAAHIPETAKTMLTCFVSNQKAIHFYEKLGYVKDEYSPGPKILRNGTKVEPAYVILSMPVSS